MCRAWLRHLFSIGENISCGHEEIHFAHNQMSSILPIGTINQANTHKSIPGWLATTASFPSCISVLCVCEHHHIHLLPWQELLEWMIQRETNDQYWTGGSNSRQEVPQPVLQGFAPTWVLSRLQVHTAQFLHYEEYCTEPGASQIKHRWALLLKETDNTATGRHTQGF